MSPRPGILYCFFSASLFIMLGLSFLIAGRFTPPLPPLSNSLSSPVSTLSDFGGMAMGFRRLTADLAWIQTILYYGTREEQEEGDGHHHFAEDGEGTGHYPLYLAYCERVLQIDPQFKHVIYYGSGVLGWNLNRLDEAEKLLKEGILLHPTEWRFQQFLAAMAFQKNHNINELVSFLEVFAEQKDCPNILRSILANTYKKQKRYRDSIRIWFMIHETGDPNYTERSTAQIQEMAPLAQKEPKNRP